MHNQYVLKLKINNILITHTEIAVIAVDGPCCFPNNSSVIPSGVLNVVTET